MKRSLLIFILALSFQSLIKADDIRDFEIEGMSVGDSLLDYFSKNNIEQELKSKFSVKYKDNLFAQLGVGQTEEFPLFKKLDKFDEIGITIVPNDKKYIIHGLIGDILCHNNINKCISVKNEIIRDLKKAFPDINIDSWERKHPIDKTGKSLVYGNTLSSDLINFEFTVSVYDMAEDKFNDSVQLSFKTKKLKNFLQNEAYD